MKYALIFSLILNILLIGFLVYMLINKPGLRPLPDKKLDFTRIEEELRKTLVEPEFAELFELMKFNHDDWLCRAYIREKFEKLTQEHYSKLQDIVNHVSITFDIPGRTAGWVPDPDEPRRFIGTIIEFGYSLEVGYDYNSKTCL